LTAPVLIILSGLPGTGKTTIARLLATALPALHLRIDRIETTLRQTGAMPEDMRDFGYQVAHGVAQDNLRLGHHVIADCVNAFDLTRRDWQAVANRADARALTVELTCSDGAEHRRRIETRRSDIPGARLPCWNDVQTRQYAPWKDADLHFDTSRVSAQDAATHIQTALGPVRD